ncbi:MAG: DUF433 domain-containing protein [Deltaproteobacteria bacterium]|nr:DUF433 domain-containing protein [Deltaproteobacteria bacterium]
MRHSRVESNPKVMLGKPVIRGTRIPVEIIVRKLAEGATVAEVLADYPQLREEDVRAALAFAADSLSTDEILPLAETSE